MNELENYIKQPCKLYTAMRKRYFYTRKNGGRVVCECISMNNRQTKQYLNLLRDMYGCENVIAVSNSKCLLVEQFMNK